MLIHKLFKVSDAWIKSLWKCIHSRSTKPILVKNNYSLICTRSPSLRYLCQTSLGGVVFFKSGWINRHLAVDLLNTFFFFFLSVFVDKSAPAHFWFAIQVFYLLGYTLSTAPDVRPRILLRYTSIWQEPAAALMLEVHIFFFTVVHRIYSVAKHIYSWRRSDTEWNVAAGHGSSDVQRMGEEAAAFYQPRPKSLPWINLRLYIPATIPNMISTTGWDNYFHYWSIKQWFSWLIFFLCLNGKK